MNEVRDQCRSLIAGAERMVATPQLLQAPSRGEEGWQDLRGRYESYPQFEDQHWPTWDVCVAQSTPSEANDNSHPKTTAP